jgi:putative zinc finger protein
MACDRMRELALLSIDGELAEAERAELAAHLERCADCRAAREAAARVAEGVRRLAPPPVPLGFAERTLKRLDEAPAPPRRRPLPWIVPLAAAAATIVGIAVFLVERHAPRPSSGTMVASEPQAAPAKAPEPSLGKARADGDKRGLSDDAPAGEERRVTELADQIDADDGTAKLLAQLASGSPAAALRRIAELPEGWKQQKEPLERAADLEQERSEHDRGFAKDESVRGGEKNEPLAGKRSEPARPALLFLRVKGDAGRLDELLAKELGRRKAPRDVAGRSVVDLDVDEVKSLRERLTAAGLVCEELTAAEWLRAAQAKPANEGLVARGEVRKVELESTDFEKAEKPESPKLKGAPEAAKKAPEPAPARGEGRTAGAAGAAAPVAPAAPAATAKPPAIERCFFLIER